MNKVISPSYQQKIQEKKQNHWMWKMVFLTVVGSLSLQSSSAMQVLLGKNAARHHYSGSMIHTFPSRGYSVQAELSQEALQLKTLEEITPYKRDKFGTFYPSWPDIKTKKSEKDIALTLASFVEHISENFPTKAAMVVLDTENFQYIPYFKEAGFEIHSATMYHIELLFKNGSPIPPPATALNVARLIMMNFRGEIVCIEDAGHPGALMFPGGYVDPNELPILAAAREGQEEVGIKTHPINLRLLAIMDRIFANKYGSSLSNRYYYTETNGFVLKPQEGELNRAFWYPLADIVKDGYATYKVTTDGKEEEIKLVPSTVTSIVLKYIFEGAKKEDTFFLPDMVRKNDQMTIVHDIFLRTG